MAPLERASTSPPTGVGMVGNKSDWRSRAYRHGLGRALSQHFQIDWRIHFALWAVIGVLVITIATWVLDPLSPIQFLSAEAVPDSGRPGAGVMTNYTVEVVRDAHTCAPGKKCSAAECSIEGERSWIDADGREWPSTTVHLGYNKGRNVIGLMMIIPANAADGEAQVNNNILWSCDPLRLFKHREPMPPLTVTVER